MFTSQTNEKLSSKLLTWRTSAWNDVLSASRNSRVGSANMMQGVWKRGFRFSARRKGAKGPGTPEAEESLSLTARLKKLTKEYGWATVGIYFALSVLDFPFCFLFVRAVGTDRIGQAEHYVVSTVQRLIPETVQDAWRTYWQSFKKAEAQALGDDDISDKMEMATWGVEKANERAHAADASLATQLALAYAIHKLFIFIRVPLTAAVTPKIVRSLRARGWNIGKKRT